MGAEQKVQILPSFQPILQIHRQVEHVCEYGAVILQPRNDESQTKALMTGIDGRVVHANHGNQKQRPILLLYFSDIPVK